jgi:DNA-binding NtrC family response regulator
VALETGEELHAELPAERPKARAAAAAVGGMGSAGTSIPPGSVLPEGVDMEKYVADVERSLLTAALAQSNGVQTKAADVLKISYRSFRHLVKKYDL